MSEEQLDVVDPARCEFIETRGRSEVHRLGLWHQVFHCLVIRPSAGTVILQRRSFDKKAFPGMLDLSATGHLSAGETPLEGIRELEEELGASFDPAALLFVGQRLLADDNGEGLNREVVNLYFMSDDRDIDAYDPPADEVGGLVEIRADDMCDLLADRVSDITARTWTATGGIGRSSVRRTDLIVDTSGYWAVLAVMADRYVRGETPIAV